MAEISIHHTHIESDRFDQKRTRIDNGSGSHWMSMRFGNLQITIFALPDDLVDITGYLYDLALNHRDKERDGILAEFDEEDRRLEVVDTRQEPPDDWPDTVQLSHYADRRVEDMGEDPFKYEHRSDP